MTRVFPEPDLSIKRREDKTGYETPMGTMPSVTTILGATSPPESKKRLEAWLARPGAREESARACRRGSWVHEQLENYLQNKPIKRHLAFNGYLQSMMPWVKSNIISPCMIEAPIWHPAGFSGTFDLLAWCDGWPELTLVDWKTSKRPRSADLVDNYLDQLAGYRLGLSHTYSVTPLKGVLVIGRPAATKPDVWVIDEEELDRRELKFLGRVQQYQEQLSTVKEAA